MTMMMMMAVEFDEEAGVGWACSLGNGVVFLVFARAELHPKRMLRHKEQGRINYFILATLNMQI